MEIACYLGEVTLGDGSKPREIEFGTRVLNGVATPGATDATTREHYSGTNDAHLVSSVDVGVAELQDLARGPRIPIGGS